MNLNEITVSQCKNVIPSKLYSKLILYDIKTLGDVKRLSSDEFRRLPGIGKVIMSILEDFKMKIEFEPEIFEPFYTPVKKTGKIKDINNLDIDKIDSISEGLASIFKKYNILTVEDIKELDLVQFSSLPNIENKYVQELERLKLTIEFEPRKITRKNHRPATKEGEPDVTKIKITRLEGFLPNILYNKLTQYKFKTVNDAKYLSHRRFLDLPGVGYKSLDQLKEFQEMIKNNPEKIIKYVQTDIGGDDVSGKDNIRLKDIRNRISPLLYRKLLQLKIYDVKTIMNMDKDEFYKLKGVGKKALKEFEKFKNMLEKRDFPDIRLRRKLIPIIPEKIEPDDLIGTFGNIIEHFKALADNKIIGVLLNNRFGIYDGKIAKLEDLGKLAGRTRERVRQIQHEMIENLNSLLQGNVVYKPDCRLSRDTADDFNALYRRIKRHDFLNFSDLQKMAGVSGKEVQKKRLLRFLMKIWNIYEIKINKNEFYVVNDNFEKHDILELTKNLIDIFNEIIIPVSLEELTERLNKSVDKDINSAFVMELCNVMKTVETVNKDGGSYYQIKFKYLTTSKRFAMRMLYETGKPLYNIDLLDIVNERLKECGIKKVINRETITAQMVMDPRFKTIGKTGIWGLSDWDFETSSIKILMIQTLKQINKPCTIAEIHEAVSAKRDDVKYHTIVSYLNHYKDHFLRIRGNKFILRKWKNKYSSKILSGNRAKRKSLSEKKFTEAVLDIFRKSGKDTLRAKYLHDEILKRKLNIGSTTVYVKLSKCRYLKGMTSGIRKFYELRKEPLPIVKARRVKRKELLIKELKEYIRSSDGQKCKLVDLTKAVEKKTDYRSETIYQIIHKHPDFRKEIYRSNRIMVSLKE